MEKPQPETKNKLQLGLFDRARLLMESGQEFVVKRNIIDVATAKKKPGRLEKGWRILNIDTESGNVTMHNRSGIFHIPLAELRNLNPEAFELDEELLKGFVAKKQK